MERIAEDNRSSHGDDNQTNKTLKICSSVTLLGWYVRVPFHSNTILWIVKPTLSVGFSLYYSSFNFANSEQVTGGLLWVGLALVAFIRKPVKALVRTPFPDLKSATAASLSAKTCG